MKSLADEVVLMRAREFKSSSLVEALCGCVLAVASCGGRTPLDPTPTDPGGAEWSPDFGVDLPPPQDEASALIQAKCPEISLAPHYCLTFDVADPAGLYALAPDTGKLCRLSTIDVVVNLTVQQSRAVLGTDLYLCNLGLSRVPIAGGSVEHSAVECTSVTTHEGRVVARQEDAWTYLAFYSSWEQIQAQSPEMELQLFPAPGSISAQADRLWSFGPGSPGPKVSSYELPSGTYLTTIELHDFLTTPTGFYVTRDGRIYLLRDYMPDTTSSDQVLSYDALTGELLAVVDVPQPLRGLHCWSNL